VRNRVWLLMVLVLACGTAPKQQKPNMRVEIADTWARSDSAAIAVGGNWWERLGDSELPGIVNDALGNNLDLEAASARLRAANGQAKIAGAPMWPQVNAGGSGAKRKQIFVGFPIPGAPGGGPSSSTSTSYGVSLDVSWELDLWGRLSAGRAAAVADRQAAQATYAGARLSLAGQTAKAWFALTEAQRQYDLAKATVDNYTTSLAQVEDRYNRGIRPSLDLRLTRTDLASARDRRHQRELLLERAKRQVELILGRYPSGSMVAGMTLPTLDEPVPAGIPSDVLSRRPDLIAAERRLAAGVMRHKEALRSRYPRISLTGSTGRTSDTLSDLTNGDFSVWGFAANLLQPLFQGGRIQGSINLTDALEDEALANYLGSVLRAFAEVETALSAEQILQAREADLTIAATEAAAARSLSEDRYRRGITDLITMLSAQRSAYLTESQLLSVQWQRLDARIDLHLALGGDFTSRETILTASNIEPVAGEKTR
jgi:multidrug efflux system outer membrane protein